MSGAITADPAMGNTKVYRDLRNVPTLTEDDVYPVGFEFKASNVVPTADENRPVNTSVLYCIKASCDC